MVAGNLPIGRQYRDGNRQVKTTARFTDVARSQVDGNARPWNLKSRRAHCAAYAATRLHHLHTWNAKHLDTRNTAGKRDLDRDGNRLDATNTCSVDGKGVKRHHDTCQSNALY